VKGRSLTRSVADLLLDEPRNQLGIVLAIRQYSLGVAERRQSRHVGRATEAMARRVECAELYAVVERWMYWAVYVMMMRKKEGGK
jgi:hypothetical protein